MATTLPRNVPSGYLGMSTISPFAHRMPVFLASAAPKYCTVPHCDRMDFLAVRCGWYDSSPVSYDCMHSVVNTSAERELPSGGPDISSSSGSTCSGTSIL